VNDPLSQLPAFRRLSPTLAASAQPDASGIDAIASAGFQILINLVPPSRAGALADEAELASRAGLHYLHLPLELGSPDPAQASELRGALARLADQRVLVHAADAVGVAALCGAFVTAG
jgi:uncharacterized protein (TIGR01244 family)